MEIIESVDPFLMQLVIMPFIVVAIGVFIAVFTKKIFIGTLITLILNLLYELWYSNYYYNESEPTITLFWNIALPIATLVISVVIVSFRTETEK